LHLCGYDLPRQHALLIHFLLCCVCLCHTYEI
jgi:hypothetical protein